MNRTARSLALTSILLGGSLLVAAQGMQDVTIKSKRLADGVYMLTGRGGNMGLCIGPDGAFLIDDQFAPLTPKILAAIRELTHQPVEFVVNTHWHGDHTGGNENLGEAGAVIVAHENVRKRMSTEQFMETFNRKVPPSPEGALPVVTFTDTVTFHLNGDEIRVEHVENAHTDGDALVFFKKANVVHMGDTFFNGMYPFIDTSSGGRIDGVIAAADLVLAGADKRTKIIPGHGEMGDAADLREYRDMLATVHDRVMRLKRDGKSREQVVAADVVADYNPTWGGGFMKPDVWIGIVYDSLP
jgi:glyoxylase-like metal-dependent hydrolase (beta-lactamase superfamily II)